MGTVLLTYGLVASTILVIAVFSYKLFVLRYGPSLALRSSKKRLTLFAPSLIIVGLLIGSGIAEQVKSSLLANSRKEHVEKRRSFRHVFLTCRSNRHITKTCRNLG